MWWREYLRRRYQRWLERRIPRSASIRLDQSSVFVFPTAEGGTFAALLIIMTLCAINYQNSLVFGLAFLLASLFVVGILHTFRNLSALKVEALGARAAFVGEDAEFRIRLTRDDPRPREALRAGWPDALMVDVDLTERRSADVKVYIPAAHRGWFRPPRLLLETTFPLGMVRAWTWLDLDLRALVYPRPISSARRFLSVAAEGEDHGSAVVVEGNDDFHGLREYRDGDSPRRIAWKRYAQQGNLVTKTFVGHAHAQRWLSWDALPGVPTEERLSRLTAWVLDCFRRGESYGLQLPGTGIAPGEGAAQRDAALRALALFGRDDG